MYKYTLYYTILYYTMLYYTCTYNSLPEDEPSGSKHVEDNVKIKILV